MFHSISALLIFAATGVVGCNKPDEAKASSVGPPISVKLATAHEEPLDALYRTSGTMRGRTTAVLTSKTVGYVRAGDRVKAGQVLAVLEANDSTASVQRAHAGLDQWMDARAEAENVEGKCCGARVCAAPLTRAADDAA